MRKKYGLTLSTKDNYNFENLQVILLLRINCALKTQRVGVSLYKSLRKCSAFMSCFSMWLGYHLFAVFLIHIN